MEKLVTTESMLMPRYVSRFACIGSDCEDACCSVWRVGLDEPTLLQYEASQDPELRPIIEKYVRRNPKPQTTLDYGHIEKRETPCQECPFLDESRLCRIQAKLGEEALSDACDSFPRNTVLCGDFHQMVLRLSCPEAARLALLEADAFDMDVSEASVRTGTIERIAPRFGLSMGEMEDIRTQLFQILQTRELDLSRRLAVMGVFCQRLTELLQQDKGANIQGLFKTMDAVMENGALQIPLKPLNAREYTRAKFAWSHLAAMRNTAVSPHQRKVLDAVASGLSIPADGSPDEAGLMRGLELGTARLEVALLGAPWLLEHYLFNEALSEVFPWSEKTPYRHFINLILGFTLLRVMLVGRAASQEATLTPQELVDTVQVFCKKTQHGAEGTRIVDWLSPGFNLGDATSLGTLLMVI